MNCSLDALLYLHTIYNIKKSELISPIRGKTVLAYYFRCVDFWIFGFIIK